MCSMMKRMRSLSSLMRLPREPDSLTASEQIKLAAQLFEITQLWQTCRSMRASLSCFEKELMLIPLMFPSSGVELL